MAVSEVVRLYNTINNDTLSNIMATTVLSYWHITVLYKKGT
jgi:hypothetical protein